MIVQSQRDGRMVELWEMSEQVALVIDLSGLRVRADHTLPLGVEVVEQEMLLLVLRVVEFILIGDILLGVFGMVMDGGYGNWELFW